MSDTVTASINRYESASGAGIEFVFRYHINEKTERCDSIEEVLRKLARVINRHQEKVLQVLLDNFEEFVDKSIEESTVRAQEKTSLLILAIKGLEASLNERGPDALDDTCDVFRYNFWGIEGMKRVAEEIFENVNEVWDTYLTFIKDHKGTGHEQDAAQ